MRASYRQKVSLLLDSLAPHEQERVREAFNFENIGAVESCLLNQIEGECTRIQKSRIHVRVTEDDT